MTSSPEGRQEAAVLDAKALRASEVAVQKWLDWCGVNNEEPSAISGAIEATRAYLSALPASKEAEAVKLNGPELWEIVFGALKGDVPEELTDAKFEEIAQHINAVFIAHPPTDAGVSEAMRKLANEVGGLIAFEPEVRQAIGNTNWAVLLERLAEADTILSAKFTPPENGLLDAMRAYLEGDHPNKCSGGIYNRDLRAALSQNEGDRR